MGAAGPSAVEDVGKPGESAGDSAVHPAAVTVLDVAGSEECRRQAKDVCFMPVVSRLSLPSTLSKCPRVAPNVSGLHADRWTSDEAAASSAVDCVAVQMPLLVHELRQSIRHQLHLVLLQAWCQASCSLQTSVNGEHRRRIRL